MHTRSMQRRGASGLGRMQQNCACGRRAVAVGRCICLRPNGRPFENFIELCPACAQLVDGSVSVEWLA